MSNIRPVGSDELDRVLAIINSAAVVYRGRIPDDCWHDPYMPEEQLRREIDSGVRFFGIDSDAELAAVMGIQDVGPVHLIRHAYVDPRHQGEGLGSALIEYICDELAGQVLVGTWRAAEWAIRFYEKHGFVLVHEEATARLLHDHWTIPERQADASVVLARLPIAGAT